MICGVKPGLRQVEFKNLLDGKKNHVKEWVRFGAPVPGTKQPLGTRKETDGKPVLRPGGPGLPPAGPSFRKTGGWPKDLWVEVYSEEAWWEGVLLEDISASQMDDEDSVVDVIFPQLEDLVEQVAMKNLRESKDWNEETGVWSIRGRVGNESVPMRIMPPESPVCEGNGTGARRQDEDSSVVEIECDPVEGTGGESKSAPQDDDPLGAKQVSIVSDKTGFKKYFGRLANLEGQVAEKCYLLRVDVLQYTLGEIQVTVKKGFISLDVTSENTETNIGFFVSKVHNVCCALLEIPAKADIDYTKISWKLHDEVLTFTLPWASPGEGRGGQDLVSLSSRS